jgi:hypothetical protein
MPTVGEKTPDYPFGYGYCQCGCGKVTRIVGGVHLKFFRRSHHPQVRQDVLDLARRRVEQVKLRAKNLSAQKH